MNFLPLTLGPINRLHQWDLSKQKVKRSLKSSCMLGLKYLLENYVGKLELASQKMKQVEIGPSPSTHSWADHNHISKPESDQQNCLCESSPRGQLIESWAYQWSLFQSTKLWGWSVMQHRLTDTVTPQQLMMRTSASWIACFPWLLLQKTSLSGSLETCKIPAYQRDTGLSDYWLVLYIQLPHTKFSILLSYQILKLPEKKKLHGPVHPPDIFRQFL